MPPDRPDDWRIPHRQAGQLIGVRRPKDAMRILTEALARFPDVSELHCQLANACLQDGDMRAALKNADRGAALAPDNEWPHRLRAWALLQLGKLRKAEAAARETVRLAPDESMAHHVLAIALLRRRNVKEALVHAERCRELAPHVASGHLALAWIALARARHAEAETHARAALAVAPDNSEAHGILGRVLKKAGRDREALDALHAATRLAPQHHVKPLWEHLKDYGVRRAAVPLVIALVGPGVVLKISEEMGWDDTPAGHVLAGVGGLLFFGGLIAAVIVARRARKEIPKELGVFVAERRSRERRERAAALGLVFGGIVAFFMGAILLGADESRSEPGVWIAFVVPAVLATWSLVWIIRNRKR